MRTKPGGCLFLVVGPSGAGKDTLLDLARKHFAGDHRVDFPKRVITRAADAGGEVHHPVNGIQFEQLLAANQIAFHWEAHGLRYGIPKTVDQELQNGRAVVVNVSRTVCEAITKAYPRVRILSISVKAEALAKRLHGRGRETAADIQSRLERAAAYHVSGDNVIEIDNSGNITDAKVAVVDAITAELIELSIAESA